MSNRKSQPVRAVVAALIIAGFWAVPSRARQFSSGAPLYRADDMSLQIEEFYDQNLSPYEDVPLGDWKYAAIQQLADRGLLGRVSADSFSMDRVLTRYEMAILVEELLANYIELERSGGVLVMERPVPRAEAAGRERELARSPLRVIAGDAEPESPDAPEAAPEAEAAKPPAPEPDHGKEAAPEELTLESVNVRVDLTLKDINDLEELVNSFKQSIERNERTIATLRRDLAGARRFESRVNRDIQRLRDEDQRFKITGTNRLRYHSEETTKRDVGRLGSTTTSFYNELNLNFTARPSPSEDSAISFSMTTGNTFGDDRGSWSPSMGDISMSYNHMTGSNRPRRRIEFRSFKYGNIGFGWISPLSLWNVSWEGVHADFLIGNFTLEMGATKRKHNGFDQYIYAASISAPLFNNPFSIFRINRLVSYDAARSRSQEPGTWSGSTLHYPPERNNVTSLWLNYPVYNKGGISSNVMAEYAHTKYYRPEWVYAVSHGSSPDPLATGGGGHTNWYRGPEMDHTGRAAAVLMLIRYRGVNIFPLGWIWMDRHFASKNLGIPGVDDLTDQLDVGGLPINIQALQVFAGRIEYNRVREENYKAEFLYVTGGEHTPMHLDPAMACAGTDALCPLTGAAGSLALAINSRRGTIDVPYFISGKFTYYVSDFLSMSAGMDKTRVVLETGHVDSFPISGDGTVNIHDDVGNVIVSDIGDGMIDTHCLGAESMDQRTRCDHASYSITYGLEKFTYGLSWQTSSRGRYNFEYRIEESSGTSPDTTIQSLLPNEKKQYWRHRFEYRLSSSTRFGMNYYHDYDAGYPDYKHYEDRDAKKRFEFWMNTSF